MDRRTRGWRLLASGGGIPELPQPRAESGDYADVLDSEVIDGIEFTYTPSGRCLVCRAGDDVRLLIDQLLVRALSYRQILQAISPMQEDVPAGERASYHSIRRHALNHVPVDELAIRQLLERRAREEGLAVVAGDSPILTNAGLAELVRQRGFEAILERGITPSVRETLEAAKLLEQIDDRRRQGAAIEDLRSQAETLLGVVRELLPADKWPELVERFERRLNDPSHTEEEDR